MIIVIGKAYIEDMSYRPVTMKFCLQLKFWSITRICRVYVLQRKSLKRGESFTCLYSTENYLSIVL